ncbi:hypothetical protein GRZ55_11710 [Chelativorans sp. ZYF759]|uniref:hypothetical protein n=1 Tax=Chelativorans sp. ZYF759 TaxID=2692213 RepID=UPI00145ED683|nr:hypothetical protein [Chelativorans sp. ZYF759]NMG39910.1 hypothetical protein [Chelativorans sp. ZYF759]
MSVATKKKGPAKAATFPDHGSTTPAKEMAMNKHFSSTETAPAATPIMELAARLRNAYRNGEAAEGEASDARRAGNHSLEWRREAAYSHFDDSRISCSHMLSMERATTIEDALVQVGAMVNLLDLIKDGYPEEHEDYRVKSEFRAMERLLFSVLAVLDQRSERSLPDLVCTSFANFHLSPWGKMDDVCGQEAAR